MLIKNKFLLLLAAFISLTSCKDENNAGGNASHIPVVDAVKVFPQDIPLSFEYAARTQGSKETEVRARVGGILLKRNYVEGRKVEEGDLLFQIDPEPFKVALEQAKAKLAQNQAQLNAAETQWVRISKLFKERIVSEKSRDEAKASLEGLQASVQLAQAEVDSAQLNLDYTTVRAPIAGITSMETQSEGSLVSVNSALTNITQLDPIYVIFSASENEIMQLGSMVDQGLIVNPKNGSNEIKAKVKYGTNNAIYAHEGAINFVNPGIDEKTGTLKLRAVFPNPDRRLLPGQFVRLLMEGIIRKDALVIPQEAVMQGAKGSFVYRINKDGNVETTIIKTGFTTPDGRWIVDEGLNSGDVVITNGLMKVKPGAPAKANLKEINLNLPTEENAAPVHSGATEEVSAAGEGEVIEYAVDEQ